MSDTAHTLLYVSSTTGQVVMDASRAERNWNYVGAWLHWLYMFRDRPVDPVWSWIVIVLSGVGVLSAVTGTLAGLWRWRLSRGAEERRGGKGCVRTCRYGWFALQ